MKYLFILLLFPWVLQAQRFEAHLVQGNVQLQGRALLAGTILPDSGLLAVENGGKLVLEDSSGKTLEVSVPGIYDLRDFCAAREIMPNALQSIAASVFQMLVGISNMRDSIKVLHQYGSVSADFEIFHSPYDKTSFKTWRGFPQTVLFMLNHFSEKRIVAPFQLTASDLTGKVFQCDTLSTPKATYHFSEIQYEHILGNTVKITVAPQGSPNDNSYCALQFLSVKEQSEEYQLMQWLYSQPTAFHSLLSAVYCEQKGLYSMATWCYEEAVRRSGNNARYVQAYNSFVQTVFARASKRD
jgi:hypothetical protein